MDEYDEDLVYHEIYFHFIWSTDKQEQLMTPSIASALYAYIGDLALTQECHLIGGQVHTDHLQLIVKATPNNALGTLLATLKDFSSVWLRTNIPTMKDFKWQKSDFAFGVSFSEVGMMIEKIKNGKSFREEVYSILDENGMEYDRLEVLD